MKTEIKHWQEWKKKCDLRVCGEDTQAAFLAYINNRLHSLVSWAKKSDAGKHDVPPEDLVEMNGWIAWDRFEGFYVDRGSRTGKVYKDWIFQAAQGSPDPVDMLEMQTCLLLRNVVREYIQQQYPAAGTVSLNAPSHSSDPDSEPLVETIPAKGKSPEEFAEASDFEKEAAPFASRFFTEMSVRERVVITALALELPASCPEAEQAAGCKKSVLLDSHRPLVKRLTARLEQERPEDAGVIRFYVQKALVKNCVDWAKGEKRCEPIFQLLAKRQAEGGRP